MLNACLLGTTSLGSGNHCFAREDLGQTHVRGNLGQVCKCIFSFHARLWPFVRKPVVVQVTAMRTALLMHCKSYTPMSQ